MGKDSSMPEVSKCSRLASSATASLSDFKRNPTGIVSSAEGEPVAILVKNKVAFYAVAPETFEAIVDQASKFPEEWPEWTA